jgi:hypothetical protein
MGGLAAFGSVRVTSELNVEAIAENILLPNRIRQLRVGKVAHSP